MTYWNATKLTKKNHGKIILQIWMKAPDNELLINWSEIHTLCLCVRVCGFEIDTFQKTFGSVFSRTKKNHAKKDGIQNSHSSKPVQNCPFSISLTLVDEWYSIETKNVLITFISGLLLVGSIFGYTRTSIHTHKKPAESKVCNKN